MSFNKIIFNIPKKMLIFMKFNNLMKKHYFKKYQ